MRIIGYTKILKRCWTLPLGVVYTEHVEVPGMTIVLGVGFIFDMYPLPGRII